MPLASTLTEEQQRTEEAWLDEFNKAANTLDWAQWEKYWDGDSFLQFAGAPRIEGKDAVSRYWREKFSVLDQLQHTRTIRRSFDVDQGLIYQTDLMSYKIKGDPQGRTIEMPGLAVIHKPIGSNVVFGFETYIDQEPIASVVRELRGMRRPQ